MPGRLATLLVVYSSRRGIGMGYRWSADPCHYPYSHADLALETSPC